MSFGADTMLVLLYAISINIYDQTFVEEYTYIITCLRGFSFVCMCARVCKHVPNVQCILIC